MARISSLEGLQDLPEGLPWEEFSCAIVEAPWAVEFLDLKQEAHRAAAAKYPGGLAFGEQSELRWLSRATGLLHVVYISDAGRDLGAGSLPEPLAEVDGEPDRLLLWGERQGDGKYYDSRIPQLLEYPNWAPRAKASGRLAVRIRHYELCLGEQVTPIFRCTGITTAEGSDE